MQNEQRAVLLIIASYFMLCLGFFTDELPILLSIPYALFLFSHIYVLNKKGNRQWIFHSISLLGFVFIYQMTNKNLHPLYPLVLTEHLFTYIFSIAPPIFYYLALVPFLLSFCTYFKDNIGGVFDRKGLPATAKRICYFIAFFYLFLGAVNDGFSGPLMCLPYLFFLILEIVRNLKNKSSWLILAYISLMFFVYKAEKSSWSFIYPMVGKEYSIKEDIIVGHNEYFPFGIDDRSGVENEHNKEIKYKLYRGQKYIVLNQYVSGHPDFSTRHIFKIQFLDKDFTSKFISRAQSEKIRWNGIGSEYKKLSQDAIYLDDYDRILPKSEAKNNIIFLLTFFLVIPLYLPCLAGFFFCRNIYLTDYKAKTMKS